MNRIRAKTYLTVLPIIAATVLTSGFLSFFASRAALTKLANRHLAYKAEQLRDYVNSEWQVVADLGLAGQEEYRKAQEDSFRSYARSILRSDTESVLVFDAAGLLVHRIGGGPGTTDAALSEAAAPRVPLSAGWFEQRLLGEDRVGISFSFEPFGWTIAATELRSRFFSDIDGILRANLMILLAAVAGASVLTAVYLGYIIGPLERLTGTIEDMTATDDLSRHAAVESADEIGMLAQRFNTLVSTVEVQRAKLIASNLSERAAHETAVQRETETLYLLGRISDYNDEDTGAHLNRIGEYSARLCSLLGQPAELQTLMRNSSPLHDIGKIAVPDAVLRKPGKLSPEEFEVIKRHAEIGYELLRNSQSRFLVEGALIAYTHHERWDGAGYPRGLSGTGIPLSGRIVSVVDVFDALTSNRPYKQAWSSERALEYIVSQRGSQFDPELVDVFAVNFALFAAS